MQFFGILVLISTATFALAQLPVKVGYDTKYGDQSFGSSSVACSSGLAKNGWNTLGNVPGFPYVGASPTVADWNSPQCGKCYKIFNTVNKKSIFVTAVDHSNPNFVISVQALNDLTGNLAVELGTIDAIYKLMPSMTSCQRPSSMRRRSTVLV
jgi:hypothetical protein